MKYLASKAVSALLTAGEPAGRSDMLVARGEALAILSGRSPGD